MLRVYDTVTFMNVTENMNNVVSRSMLEARFAILSCLDSDPAKNFGSFRIRIRSIDKKGKLALRYYVERIRIQQQGPDSLGFGSVTLAL
jgi:hypothetical protein